MARGGEVFMIRVGTAGYSYKDWIGPFYPEGIKPQLMLKYYSQVFDFTEINYTYYKVPDPKNFYKMAEITPLDFMFTVKLFGGMTHTRDSSDADYEKFLQGIRNLDECGKLGCLVAQFPNSFGYTKENLFYLEKLKEHFQDYKLALEFRNAEFVNLKVLDFMKEKELSFICVDEPKVKGLVQSGVIRTDNNVYIRFHGRNESKWYNNNASYERYDYLYTEKELKEWSGAVKGMEHSCDDLYISFNNHFNGQAIINAKMMKTLLGME